MSASVRWIAAMFLTLSVLAGVTLGTPRLALANAVVFTLASILAVRLARPRWGADGAVYGMGLAFLLSILWPYAWMIASGSDCVIGQCLARR